MVEEPYIYHYTDAQAVFGIVQSRSIWATDSEYLNDGLEGRTLSDLLRIMIDSPTVYRTGGIDPKYLEALKSHLTHGRRFYVASFSKRYRMLNQFRLYCPPAGGFVIGFPRSFLEKAGTVLDVNYDDRYHLKWARDFFEKFIADAKATDSTEKTAEQLARELTTLARVYERCLEDIKCKSPDYGTEEESRFVASSEGETSVRPAKAGNLFIPYREISLPNEEVLVKIASGPGRSRQLAQQSISELTHIVRRTSSKWHIGILSIGEFGHREL